jgi:hypothetical protein
MLHGFKISAGDVAYSNKFVATTQRKAALRTGTLAGCDVMPFSNQPTTTC